LGMGPPAIPCPQKFNKLPVDSRLIGRVHDDRFAMVAGSLLRIAMINVKQGERIAP
jgi:hypothetical protein